MSLFDDALAIASDPRFLLYGEEVTLTPQRTPSGEVNARTTADGSRQPVTCIGIWDETPTDLFPQSQQYPGRSSHQLSAGTVVLSILKDAVPWVPLQNDIVTRVKTGERMKIADQAYDGITDWDLTLSAQKG